MTEEVAALNVRLEATVAKFERDLGRATRRLQRETRTMDKSLQRTEFNARNLSRALGTAAGVLGSFATAAVVRQVEAIARRLDEIGKTADKLGLTTDALQELRAAAEDSGIGARTASVALQRFTRRVAEARSGTGEAKAALEELGISFRGANGEAKSSEELLNDVADAMSRIEDPADRVRLAFKLFDSEGVNFVNLLREGSEGLERLRKSARDTGQVVDESLIRQSEEAVTQLGRLDRKIDADLARTLANLQPLLVAFKEGLAEATGFAADLVEELNRVNDVELFIANAPAARAERQALREWEQLVARREALADRIANGGDNANNRLALADLDRQIAITRPGRDGPSTRRGPRGSRETTPETVATDPGGPRRPSRSGRSASRPIDTFAPAVQSTQERINRLELERDALGQTAAEAARAAIEFETAALKRDLLTRAMETGSGVTDQEAEVIDGLVGEFEQLSLAIAATEENQQRLAKAQREADQAAERSARSIEQLGNRFASAVQSADNLQDALRNVGIELLNLAAQGLSGNGPLSGLLGGLLSGFLGGGGGFSFGALSGIGSFSAAGTSPALSFPGFSKGTRSAPGGLAWVGEEGPELMDVPAGARIFPHDVSRRMASGTGGGDMYLNINVSGVATDEVVGRIRDETVRGFNQLRAEIPSRAVAGIERSPDLRGRLR